MKYVSLYKEVSSFQGYIYCNKKAFLGNSKGVFNTEVSLYQGCPLQRGSTVIELHVVLPMH